MGKYNSELQRPITLLLSEWLLSETQEITSIGKDVEKWEPVSTDGGNEIGLATVGDSKKAHQKN